MQHMKISKNIAISDAGLVFNPINGESYSVNPIGIEILGLIKAGKSPAEIYKVIQGKYIVEESTFEKDFQDFVSLLDHYQLSESHGEKKA
jgi:hypothetical protein